MKTRGRFALEIRRARGGLAALIGLVVLTIGAMAVIANGLRLNLPWSKTYTARVAVADAKGVVAGKQQVRISGLPVGKIDKVSLVDGHPILTITLKGKYAPLYRDAKLRLRPKTPLDDLYLNVESRGHKSAGRLDSGNVLAAQQTTAPVDIGRVLDTFNVDTRQRMEQAIDELGKGLPDRGDDLRRAIAQLAPFLLDARRLTQVTAERRGATRHLVHNLRVMLDELGTRDKQLTALVRGGSRALGSLGAQDASLESTLNELPPTLEQLQPAFDTLRATTDELDPAFDKLRGSAKALPSGLAALRSFSDSATPALRAIRTPLAHLRTLVAQLRPTAAGLDGAFTKLEPTAPRLDRVTAAIVPCELAVQKFFNNTLSLMKFSDARGLIPRGQTVDGMTGNQRAGKSCAAGGPRK